ncbi:ROK family protein [Luteimicrobium album]|uniref:ROK family protein n=1 Tax=Luteimicrobium album TaxID=1054550 RepID=UPI0024E0D289|nr:ROK family protein [Luteimicrobium album]
MTRDHVRLAVVGVSAAVDEADDTLRFAEDFPRWPATGVRRRLADALGCDVVLDNDVKLAAVAEREDGAGRGEDAFTILWMGQGWASRPTWAASSCAAPRARRGRSATCGPRPRSRRSTPSNRRPCTTC